MSIPLLAAFRLRLAHLLYSLFSFFNACWQHFKRPTAQHLKASRRQLPKHLAILLYSDGVNDVEAITETYLESVKRASAWCRTLGIRELTVYDREGVLISCSQRLSACLRDTEECDGEGSDSEIEYPLTPPLSDSSDSGSTFLTRADSNKEFSTSTFLCRLRSGPHKLKRHRGVLTRRHTSRKRNDVAPEALTIHVASRTTGKPFIASVAQSLMRAETRQDLYRLNSEYRLSVHELNDLVEGKQGVASPDLMIVHSINRPKFMRPVLEFYGFPPWQIRLTEFQYLEHMAPWNWPCRRSDAHVALEEFEFRAALDEFASAEMRLGK